MVSRVNRGCTKKQEKGGKMEKLEYSLFYQKFYIESNEHYDFVTLFRPLGTLLNSLYVLAVARAETRKDPLESPRRRRPSFHRCGRDTKERSPTLKTPGIQPNLGASISLRGKIRWRTILKKGYTLT